MSYFGNDGNKAIRHSSYNPFFTTQKCFSYKAQVSYKAPAVIMLHRVEAFVQFVNYQKSDSSGGLRLKWPQYDIEGVRLSTDHLFFLFLLQVIRKSLLSGYFQSVAELQLNNQYKLVIGGHNVCIHPSSALFQCKPQYVLYNELVQTNKCYMRWVEKSDILILIMRVQLKWGTCETCVIVNSE